MNDRRNYLDRLAELIYNCTDIHMRPMDESDRPLYLAYALLCRSKGESVTSEDVHDAWSLWATLHHGEHRSLIPFSDLSPQVQAYDDKYRDAIAQVARMSGRVLA